MADYRIVAAIEPASGLYFVELFYPSDALKPVAKTKAVYASDEEAQRRVGESLKAVFIECAAPLWDALVIDSA